MRLNRLLTYINVLIGIALAAALAVGYWFAYRVLPKTSGGISAPISGAGTITRDNLGVPHIRAASLEDAFFLQGYVLAQDRLWQMDALRRLVAGELAEVVGAAALETDRETRRLRMRRLAQGYVRTIPADDRKYMAAYARGVNHFIDTHRGALPLEFTLLGYEPRPWLIADSVLVGLQMFRDMTTTWRDDVLKSRMIAKGDKSLARQLFPVGFGDEVTAGSNAWVISGNLTASGKPILANDTHLQFSIPSPWYQVHLQAPGLNVGGDTLPGVPAVILGHNDQIAWGVTNLHFDVQDVYLERLNVATGQYLHEGRVEQARAEREYIGVKGARPVEFVNWVTRHGPMLTASGGQDVSLRWAAAELGTFDFPFVQLNQATNWTEFRRALSRFGGPGQNFVYADRSGNIGYQATGSIPIRERGQGDQVLDGTTTLTDWKGFVPFEDLPQAFNPPNGMIVTANQNPFPSNYHYPVLGSFGPSYRASQIRARLESKKGWRAEEMIAIQKDVYSSFLHRVAQYSVKAFDKGGKKDEETAAAVGLLRNWNGQMEKGTAAPFLVTLLYDHLRRAMAERAVPGSAEEYSSSMAGPVLDRLLRDRPKEWFQDYDELLVRSLLDAIEEARRKQGRDPKRWNYGTFLELRLVHPVGSRIPILGPYFNVGPVQMSGSGTTIKQTSQRLGPSMRFVADLSDWNRSLSNITLGQSGQFLSSHYKDQWERYYAGEGIAMPWSEIKGKTLQVNPEPR